ncbi:MAG: PH domain-containing protein [Candidatus Limnocylindrales bacterium]|jgi:uncharacterized membrane protein YdbT with pleckstrin-like domain
MSYADSLMAKEEQILYRARQHWLAPLSDSLKAIVLVLLGLVVFFLATIWKVDGIGWQIMAGLSAVLLIIGIVWIGIVYVTWRSQEYVISTRRVLKVEGVLDKKSGDSSLDKINDAVLKQGLLARMLHYGDLDILTANEDSIDRYQMLAHVVDFKKAMLNAKNDLEDGYRGSASSPRPAAAAPSLASAKSSSSDDVTATLAKLADLRDKGAITPAEYEAKKAELLGRL